MEWDKAGSDNPMLRYYKRLIQLRRASRALQSGEPAILLADDKSRTLAYSRKLGGDVAIVAVNRSDKPQSLTIPLPDDGTLRAAGLNGFVDGLSGRRFSPGASHSLSITLAPLQAAIMLPAVTMPR
jgi:hypothetical protein